MNNRTIYFNGIQLRYAVSAWDIVGSSMQELHS